MLTQGNLMFGMPVNQQQKKKRLFFKLSVVLVTVFVILYN